MDADDVCFPERFARQLLFLESQPQIDLVGARAVVFSESDEVMGLLPFREHHDAICARPFIGFYLAHPTWFGRSDWFRRHLYGVPEAIRAEDQELLLRAMGTSRYAALPDVLLGYRAHTVTLEGLKIARRSLLKSQTAILWQRRNFLGIIKAFAAFTARTVKDYVDAKGGKSFVLPMPNLPPPPHVSLEFQQLIKKYK
jgi:hypothetical protein